MLHSQWGIRVPWVLATETDWLAGENISGAVGVVRGLCSVNESDVSWGAKDRWLEEPLVARVSSHLPRKLFGAQSPLVFTARSCGRRGPYGAHNEITVFTAFRDLFI